MRRSFFSLILLSQLSAGVYAQSWPDYHLTTGTHTNTYGVAEYDPDNPLKNLYIESSAVVYAGSELADIYDSNEVFLSGGSLYARTIDTADFHFDAGRLEISGTLTGLAKGSEQIEVGRRTITLSGSSASWNAGDLIVYAMDDLERHTDNLYVNNGASLISSSADLAGIIEISGAGSSWVSGDMVFGGRDTYTGKLKIKDGAEVFSTECLLGNSWVGNSGNEAVVSGTDSLWRIDGALVVGQSDNPENNLLVVQCGGRMSVDSAGIGVGPGRSLCNKIVVEGGGSSFQSDGQLNVGGRESWGNQMLVASGGTASSSNCTIGTEWKSWLNRIEVFGVGSVWTNRGSLVVGRDDSGYGNRLEVSAGGEAVLGGNIETRGVENWIGIKDGGRLTVTDDLDLSKVNLNFDSGGTLSVGGQLSGFSLLEEGCRLETANVLGDLTVDGIFAPGQSPADSFVDGNLTITAGGMLEMEIGQECDRLTVSGLANLDGMLSLVFDDGFVVTNGASFNLFSWDGGVNGSFSAVDAPILAGGLEWDMAALQTTGSMHVIPEPSTISLLGVGAAVGWIRYRKRRMVSARRRSR